jgi:hypothetical protein
VPLGLNAKPYTPLYPKGPMSVPAPVLESITASAPPSTVVWSVTANALPAKASAAEALSTTRLDRIISPFLSVARHIRQSR